MSTLIVEFWQLENLLFLYLLNCFTVSTRDVYGKNDSKQGPKSAWGDQALFSIASLRPQARCRASEAADNPGHGCILSDLSLGEARATSAYLSCLPAQGS